MKFDKKIVSWKGEIESRALIDSLSGQGKRCIAVLQAYLDESGTHSAAPVLCVAGYLATAEEWILFTHDWSQQIAVSEVEYFHAKELSSRPLKSPLAFAIDKRNFLGVLCAVRHDVFKAFASSQLKSGWGNAYAVCAFTCARALCRMAYKMQMGAVSLFYETGQPNADYVERAIKALQRHNDPELNIAAIAMVKKESFLPLATADFLAHSFTSDVEWYNYLTLSQKVLYVEMTQEKLTEMSCLLKSFYSNQRRLRRALRKGIGKIEIIGG